MHFRTKQKHQRRRQHARGRGPDRLPPPRKEKYCVPTRSVLQKLNPTMPHMRWDHEAQPALGFSRFCHSVTHGHLDTTTCLHSQPSSTWQGGDLTLTLNKCPHQHSTKNLLVSHVHTWTKLCVQDVCMLWAVVFIPLIGV